MNTTLDNTFETNFMNKYNSESKYAYEKLINMLHSDDVREKHFAILELEEIRSPNDTRILVSNLVGQDGKIREAVAFKINEFSKNQDYKDFFIDETIFGILIQGIMDINGNVCRQIIDGKWFEDKEFQTYLCNELPERINEILQDIEKIDQTSKQYIISKRNFQLYWCLEALYNIIDVIEFESIKNIIFKTGEFHDYTIREKTAKILTKIDNEEVRELKEKLKNDENYYVRKYLIER